MHRPLRLPLALALLAALPAAAAEPTWVERSNQNAQVLLATQARFAPEQAGLFGVEGLDEEVFSLPLDRDKQVLGGFAAAAAELERRRAAERDPAVLQDLDIMLADAQEVREGIELDRRTFLPVFDLPQT